VQGALYSESKVENDVTPLQLETSVADLELETDATALELETSVASLKLETEPDALDLEKETGVPQEISKQERYLVD
jgi:hypothetical protein